MNPKMFALLLLIPVAVFATDKLTTAPADGGGKEKRKTEATQTAEPEAATTTTEVTVTETPEAVAVQSGETKTEPAVKPKPVKTETAATTTIKAMIEEIRSPEGPYYSNQDAHMYLYDTAIDESLGEWLKEEIKGGLEKANPLSIDLAESFSRCPSGYHVLLISKDNLPTQEGWMIADDGCWDRPIAKFRYDFAAKTIEADAGTTLGYLPLDEFFSLLKAAKV